MFRVSSCSRYLLSRINKTNEWLQNKYGADRIRAESIEYNRWLQVIPPVTTMLCLGGMYSWSLYNGPLTHNIGIITQLSTDWSLSSIVPVFGTLVFFNGVAGALLGKWIDKSGPKISYSIGGLMYGGGLILGSIGVTTHILPLLYFGYGIIGGLGHGICYISSISTLIQFFPDKRGLAAGMSLMGLGGGAIIATPIIDTLLTKNFKPPIQLNQDLLISASNTITINENGQSFINLTQNGLTQNGLTQNGLTQIVKLNISDLISSGFSSKIMSTLIDGGTYLVGSGSTGAATTMFIVGTGYLGIILTSSLFTKLPHLDFNPIINKEEKEEKKIINNNNKNMNVEQCMKSPQFWYMWIAFGALSSTGMGCISTAKTMMSEVFGSSLPLIVTSSFASTYVMAISASNLLGRIGWGFISDKIGQFSTYTIFGFTGMILYALIPFYVYNVVQTPSITPLILFYGSTLCLFSYFGGGFSVMPSYEAKLFGAKNVGAIHGRMMTACALSGFIGPMIITQCRQYKYKKTIYQLSEYVNPQLFYNQFGSTIDNLPQLIENKVVTINKLMQIIPHQLNIQDPTPFLYNETMFAMSGCMAICATANLFVKFLGTPKQMR